MTPRASTSETTPGTCPHHWVIETPNGTCSQGRCKRCGDVAEFRNSSEDLAWMDERYQASVRKGHRRTKAS